MTKSSGQAGPPSDTHSVLGRRRAFIITDLVLRLLRELKMDKNKKEAVLLKNSLFSMVPVVLQHFSKNTVISMVLGHPNSEITCIPPS